ncbi:uncharacterized protein MELLADRAFT_92754 [Melampsora larici-populina 98AG31]|uniref:Uncharacterized protein n=1 Tax=Melampsora larici-populina (strain 98AG31 / pathotype 3-4-7) TaxID=747676 RepID=F4S2M1_MELLP|nr:uncharacterized protein MELLADRAFT_92754 [Melampsora larici-populina 98AG31]EGG01106.1 hypothetical protein MELLADRAFT_92754 [Melampsora larici-populina 98AG31]
MSNPSAITPAATPVTGYMNSLFEEPEERVGDKRQSTCLKQALLLCVGTAACDAFDQNNLMTFKVRFKIYTDTEVNINAPNQSTPKVGASKKVPKSSKLNLIDSKAINTGYLETKICVFGKSLNEFKDLVAGACEKYEAGMKNVILNSPFSPDLKWKATIGRSKMYKLKRKIRQASATKKLIATTNRGGTEVQETKELKKERELATFANAIFSKHTLEKSKGGPANIATTEIPPNTSEFRYEINESRWFHPDMGVDHQVELCLQGKP